MNILVTGANGQLGNELRVVSLNSTNNYIFTDVTEASEDSILMLRRLAGNNVNTSTKHLDITNLEDIREFVLSEKIDVTINCAAYTNVDAAEQNKEIAELLNAQAVKNLAIAMKEVNGLLVHVSTDYVFGGDPYNTPCSEDQKGTPTGVYGLTKLQGEEKILESGVHYLIFRTAWLYSEFGKNFVKTMLSLTATKPQLKVVFDQTGTPTYAYDLAKAIYNIIENRIYEGRLGIYHYSNEGVCSWFDFTKMIAEYSRQMECNIMPCHSNEFPSPVKRPAYSVLDKTKVKDTFGTIVPYWTESLKICIKNLKSNA